MGQARASFLVFGLWKLPFADIAQLGERQTEDLKVPGSIPGVGSVIILLQVFYFFRPLRCVSFTGKVSLREVLSLW